MTVEVSGAKLADTRVGVVIVSHQQQYLTECLQSVLEQSLTPDAVLVDNASPTADSASQIAARMGLQSVRLEKARSLGTARNVGCEVLDDCEYLLTLDGDDVLESDFVAVFLETAIRQRADVVYGPAELFGSRTGVEFAPTGHHRDLRRGNFIPATSLFSRRIWRAAGGFDPRLAYFEDWDFWLSCAEHGARFHAVNDVLWRYRRHDASMLATADESGKAAARRYIREKHLSYIWGPFQWRRLKRDVQKTLKRG